MNGHRSGAVGLLFVLTAGCVDVDLGGPSVSCDAGTRRCVEAKPDGGQDAGLGEDHGDAGLSEGDAGPVEADAGFVELSNLASTATPFIVAPAPLATIAAELGALVQQSTGRAPVIVSTRPAGSTAIELSADAGQDLTTDGFRISSPDPATIRVDARTPTGVANGVFDVLERSLGVRWLMPYAGAAGTHVPPQPAWRVSRASRVVNPGFLERRLSAGYVEPNAWAQWMRHLGMDSYAPDPSFHHNLYEIFPPSRYRRSHPHFYPVVGGVRYPLESSIGTGTDSENHSWQPVLTAPGLLDAGVENVVAFFRQHPTREWYSLGMNDSVAWGDDAVAGRALNALGYVDMSDPYFAWVNHLVRDVNRAVPGKRFGLLAYHNLADAPSFAVEPNVVPYLTYDRMMWLDPARRQRDQLRTTGWEARARQLGWYDYVYGDQPIIAGAPIYSVPRIYPHVLAEAVAFGHAHGVRYYYAEAYPSTDAWTEGPKLYVLMKLLWNPTANVDALLQDWYRAAVGEAAAPALARYFAHWEAFWRTRAVQTSWFTRSSGDYLDFSNTSYLEQLTAADRDTLDRAMAEVVAQAPDGGYAVRARVLEQGWQAVRRRAFGPEFDLTLGTTPAGFSRSYAEAMDGPDGGQALGWLPWTRPNVQTELLANGFDTTTKASGSSSLHLSLRALSSETGMAWNETSVPAAGATSFCVRARVRATSDTAGLYLELQSADGGQLQVRKRHFGATDGGFVFRVNCVEHADAGVVRLAAFLETFSPGTASAWFDDVELYAR